MDKPSDETICIPNQIPPFIVDPLVSGFRGNRYIYCTSSFYSRVNFAFAKLDLIPNHNGTTVSLTFPHPSGLSTLFLVVSAMGWASLTFVRLSHVYRWWLFILSFATLLSGYSVQIAGDRYQIVDFLRALLDAPNEVKNSDRPTEALPAPSVQHALDVGEAMERMDRESAGIERFMRQGFLALSLFFIAQCIFNWIAQSHLRH